MKRFLICATAMLVAAPAFAYTIEDLRRDAKAQWEKVQKDVGDLAIEQEATFNVEGQSGGMKSKLFMRGKKWRMEGEMSAGREGQSIETVTLFDGDDIWTVTMGMKSKLPKNAVGPGTAQSFWSEPAEGGEVVGEETVQGRACWKVQHKGDGAPVTTWFDKSNFMPVQMMTKMSGKELKTVFSDFRKVKGHEVPHMTEVFSEGKKTVTSKIIKVEPNASLSADLFDPEKLAGGEGMDMNAIMKQAEEMKKKMMESQGK